MGEGGGGDREWWGERETEQGREYERLTKVRHNRVYEISSNSIICTYTVVYVE